MKLQKIHLPMISSKKHLLATTAALALMLPASAPAIIIDFETASGYSTTGGTTYANGNLVGQPSGTGVTKWTGTTTAGSDDIRVVADGGGQVAQTTNNASTPYYRFLPSDADLGGTFNSASSLLAYSFNVRYDTALAANGALVRPRFGDANNPITNFELDAPGTFIYNDGAANFASKTVSAGGTNFIATKDVWFVISGVIDYGTDTYTLFVNGVQQTGSGGAGDYNLNFLASGVQTAEFNMRDLGGGGATYVQLSFDNISLQLVPENGTGTLMGLALALMAFPRRRPARKS